MDKPRPRPGARSPHKPVRPALRKPAASAPRHGLARVLSKLGYCSRAQAQLLVEAGRVTVNGRIERNYERPTDASAERIAVDGIEIRASDKVYIALNKPRGIVVSADDERGRDTVYALLETAGLPWLGPVGRLDKASEGLLLLSNDTVWAAGITDPATQIDKTYHVQVAGLPGEAQLAAMRAGVVDAGERLVARRATLLRSGEKNAWLEVVLDEGRNRQIRRMLAALDLPVLRLLRVAIGPVQLGELAKGAHRRLSEDEVRQLSGSRR